MRSDVPVRRGQTLRSQPAMLCLASGGPRKRQSLVGEGCANQLTSRSGTPGQAGGINSCVARSFCRGRSTGVACTDFCFNKTPLPDSSPWNWSPVPGSGSPANHSPALVPTGGEATASLGLCWQQGTAWSPGLGFVPAPNVLSCLFRYISGFSCGWGWEGGSHTGAGIF